MAGVQHQNAADQFDEFEQAARTILHQIHTAPPEEVSFPEGEEPVFHKRKGLNTVQVCYDTKKKVYTTQYHHSGLKPGDTIEVDLGNFSLHYCWHSGKNAYVRIKDPTRDHAAKYYTTCQGYHIFRERQIKVDTLLAFATRQTMTIRDKIHSSAKTPATEDQVLEKFSHYKCYIELIKTIVEKVKDIHSRDVPPDDISKHKEDINALVDAMKTANVQPKCKPFANPITAADFATGHDDTELMALVELLIANQLTQADITAEPAAHADNPRKYRTKRKEHWCSKIAEIQAELRAIKEEPKDSDVGSVISLQSGISTATTALDQGKQFTSSATLSKQMIENIPRFDGKQGNVNQFISQIESYSKLYSIHKVELTLLQTLGRPYEILSHAIAEDPDVEWSQI